MKMSGNEKKRENENKHDISPIKRVTKKFLEVSPCSLAKQQQTNVQKMLFLANEPAKKAEINILTSRDTTGPGF